MTWTSAAKNLTITAKLPYPGGHPKVVGRAPVSTAISFTWFEFMLATAKASHLSYVAPSAVAPEVELMVRLVGPHVDDVSLDFAILASAGRFKDYVGTFFTGTVAAGLAVRAMVEEGYVWFAHFEALGSTAGVNASPDYAMLGPTLGIALMEAKGSAAKDEATFVGSVRKGYRKQVPDTSMLCRDPLYDRRWPLSSVSVASLPSPRRLIDEPPPTSTPLAPGTLVPMPGFCPPPKLCGRLRTTSPRLAWPPLRIASRASTITGEAAGAPRMRLPVTTISSAGGEALPCGTAALSCSTTMPAGVMRALSPEPRSRNATAASAVIRPLRAGARLPATSAAGTTMLRPEARATALSESPSGCAGSAKSCACSPLAQAAGAHSAHPTAPPSAKIDPGPFHMIVALSPAAPHGGVRGD
jgi:hypothetical protein